jgi:hypothetical protein
VGFQPTSIAVHNFIAHEAQIIFGDRTPYLTYEDSL